MSLGESLDNLFFVLHGRKYPISHAEYHELEDHDFWDAKGYMSARVLTPDGAISVVNVHLASTGDTHIRESELTELVRYVRSLAEPVLGDFNLEPDVRPFSASRRAFARRAFTGRCRPRR